MKITAVRILIAVNVLVYGLQYVSNGLVDQLFALWPLQPLEGQVYFRPWQVVSYAFLHDTGSIYHLLFNMWGLWIFGEFIERYVGPRRLLALYFASIVTAALTQLYVPAWFSSPPAPTLGASGGVFGLLLAFAVLFPRQKMFLLFLPVPIPAYAFVPIYAIVELVLGVTGRQAGVAHFAHLGGMVGSALVLLQWRMRTSRT